MAFFMLHAQYTPCGASITHVCTIKLRTEALLKTYHDLVAYSEFKCRYNDDPSKRSHYATYHKVIPCHILSYICVCTCLRHWKEIIIWERNIPLVSRLRHTTSWGWCKRLVLHMRAPLAACREPAGSYNRPREVLYVLNIKHNIF